MKKSKLIKLLVLGVFIILGVIYFRHQPPKTATRPSPNTTPVFNKQQYSISDSGSIWVVINKKRPINPADYIPANLVMPSISLRVPGNESMQVTQPTATALEKMFAAAQNDGISLMLSSGYRSYVYQQNLYNNYVEDQGQVYADTVSARPGYSEHQTGLAADIEPNSRNCELNLCFIDTPEGKWLSLNAYRYGFIIRYPANKTSVTGYAQEPWHARYIGAGLAAEMHKEGISTLEEFFGLGAAPNY